MITEAYTVFGALFLGAMYNLWEFGSDGPRDGLGIGSDLLNTIFATVMSIGLTANLFLTLFASFWWQMSILWGGSNDNFAYSNMDALTYCLRLLFVIFTCVIFASILAIYGNLREHLSALLIAQIFLVITVICGTLYNADLVAKEIPFELNKESLWVKSIFPLTYNTKMKRDIMKANGMARREELLSRVEREITINNIQMDDGTEATESTNEGSHGIRLLLKKAADNLGRDRENVTPFVIRLEQEWYTNVESIQGVSVATLARFMPHALAAEVNKLASTRPRGSASLAMRRSSGSRISCKDDGNELSDNLNNVSEGCEEDEEDVIQINYELKKNIGGKAGAFFF